MKIIYEDNEFTGRQLIEYMRRTYGTQINGHKFARMHIDSWEKFGNIPDAYGGHKISAKSYKEANDLKVYTVEGLSREDLEYSTGSLDIETVLPKIDKRREARKKRTPLYYQIAGSRNTTIKTLEQSTLPKNYKALGINGNQVKSMRYQSNAKKNKK